MYLVDSFSKTIYCKYNFYLHINRQSSFIQEEKSMSQIKQIYNGQLPLPVIDPFIFTMYHEDYYPIGTAEMAPATTKNQEQTWRMYYGKKIPGFPAHPHRGFETITIVEKGMVDHTDSLGSRGRYGEGDVQWMTAGEGVQHAEMFPLLHEERDNTLQLFQIWLNLPHNNKMITPHYKMLWREKIPIITQVNDQGAVTFIKVIGGTFAGTKALAPSPKSWAEDPHNHVGIFIVTLDPSAKINLPAVSPTLSRMVYIFNGQGVSIDQTTIKQRSLAVLDGNQVIEIKNTTGDLVKLLILEGEPINEPVAAMGPFVMNSKEEVLQAYYDFNTTQFGGWPYPTDEPVNNKYTGRYAQYADGRVETPDGVTLKKNERVAVHSTTQSNYKKTDHLE